MPRNPQRHTPGPWWIDDDGFVSAGSADTYKTIADPRCMPPQGKEKEIDANARLIAAAPALLEALQDLVEVCPCRNGCKKNDMTCATNKARAAIAAATEGE